MALITGLLLLAMTSPSFEACEHDRKSHHAYEALHEKRPLFIKAIVRLGLHAACTKQTVGENDGVITALSGIAVALFTLALWISAEKLSRVASEQSADARRSLDIAERALAASERSWILVEVSDWGDLTYPRHGNPNLDLTFSIRNVGKTPAINVQLVAEMIGNADDAFREVRELADEYRQIDEKFSRMLLPGQEHKREWAVALGRIEACETGHYLPGLIICVTYQVLPALSVHQTLACYSISELSDDPRGATLLKAGSHVRRDKLSIEVTS